MSIIPESFAEIEAVHTLLKEGEYKSIALTSSQGKEGVSEIILSLAKRASVDGTRVIIVDMNSFSPLLPVDHQRKNWFVDDFDSQKMAMTNYTNNIDILNYPELASGEHIKLKDKQNILTFIEFWQQTYDLIIFDTSPLNAINTKNISPILIGGCCDGISLVVAPGNTSEYNLIAGLSKLENSNSNVMGIIVNEMSCPPLNVQITRSIHNHFENDSRFKKVLLSVVEYMPFQRVVKE